MSFKAIEAVDGRSLEMGAQPPLEGLTPREYAILRFYRQLTESDQLMMMRMLEALVMGRILPK